MIAYVLLFMTLDNPPQPVPIRPMFYADEESCQNAATYHLQHSEGLQAACREVTLPDDDDEPPEGGNGTREERRT